MPAVINSTGLKIITSTGLKNGEKDCSKASSLVYYSGRGMILPLLDSFSFFLQSAVFLVATSL